MKMSNVHSAVLKMVCLIALFLAVSTYALAVIVLDENVLTVRDDQGRALAETRLVLSLETETGETTTVETTTDERGTVVLVVGSGRGLTLEENGVTVPANGTLTVKESEDDEGLVLAIRDGRIVPAGIAAATAASATTGGGAEPYWTVGLGLYDYELARARLDEDLPTAVPSGIDLDRSDDSSAGAGMIGFGIRLPFSRAGTGLRGWYWGELSLTLLDETTARATIVSPSPILFLGDGNGNRGDQFIDRRKVDGYVVGVDVGASIRGDRLYAGGTVGLNYSDLESEKDARILRNGMQVDRVNQTDDIEEVDPALGLFVGLDLDNVLAGAYVQLNWKWSEIEDEDLQTLFLSFSREFNLHRPGP